MHRDVRELTVSLLYRDEDLVVVDKPAGMLVHRSEGARDPIVVMTFVRDLLGTHVYPVHRLDRATSGAVIVALTAESARRINALFQKRLVQKTYFAVVRGHAPDVGRIDTPLEKREGVWQTATTEFETVARSGDAWTLLRVSPLNGRKHQIRRHLQSIGTPIAGDPLYGTAAQGAPAGTLASAGLPPAAAASFAGRALHERLGLHASRLSFPHPSSGERVDVVSPLPDDFRALLAACGSLAAPADL